MKDEIKGISCEVKNCVYHDMSNACTAGHIKVGTTNAKSTNLTCPESAEQLCSKCDDYAKAWAKTANDIWNEQERFHPFTQYYRDTEEAKDSLRSQRKDN